VMIGGIEASLRRVTHFDYWSDTLKPSILAESGADLLVYGMGELPLKETVRLLKRGVPFASLTTIPQTAVLLPPDETAPKNKNWDDYTLHSHEECQQDRALYSKNFKDIETESNRVKARRLFQPTGDRLLVVNPPFPTMTEDEIDSAFDLPYTRLPHPKYRKRGPIPAYEMIKHSINMHRGCFGGCSFCTISAHQGKFVASRSKASILREVESIKQMPDFRGTISDLGGPSGNMYKMKGKEQWICDECVRPSCIWPDVCRNLDQFGANKQDALNCGGIHWQIKYVEALNIWKALNQAVTESDPKDVPIVAFRRNRSLWYAAMELDELIPLLRLKE